jgi:hypothetical protein
VKEPPFNRGRDVIFSYLTCACKLTDKDKNIVCKQNEVHWKHNKAIFLHTVKIYIKVILNNKREMNVNPLAFGLW